MPFHKSSKERKFFKCLNCKLEANRDAVGVLNIAHLHEGRINRMVAHPLLLVLRDEVGA